MAPRHPKKANPVKAGDAKPWVLSCVLFRNKIARLPKVTKTILCFLAWLLEARSFYRMPSRQGCAVPHHGTQARRHTSRFIDHNPFSPIERLKGITDPEGLLRNTFGVPRALSAPDIVFRTPFCFSPKTCEGHISTRSIPWPH